MLISQHTDDVRDREREWDLEHRVRGRGASDVEVNEVVEPTVAERFQLSWRSWPTLGQTDFGQNRFWPAL